MFCPDCGAAEQTPDAYCKRCGKYLPDTSIRGRFLGGINPEKTARAIAGFSILVALICLCISFLILHAEESGNVSQLKYAFVLCWAVIGYLVTLSLVCTRLMRRMKAAQGKQGLKESVQARVGAGSGGVASAEQRAGRLQSTESSEEATTEPLR